MSFGSELRPLTAYAAGSEAAGPKIFSVISPANSALQSSSNRLEYLHGA
jgi:hypothetical protein